MIQLVLGGIVFIVGLPFFVRGWIFFLFPSHPITMRTQERNMRLGLDVDMKKWSRRVRRFGLILCAVGALLVYWGYTIRFMVG